MAKGGGGGGRSRIELGQLPGGRRVYHVRAGGETETFSNRRNAQAYSRLLGRGGTNDQYRASLRAIRQAFPLAGAGENEARALRRLLT